MKLCMILILSFVIIIIIMSCPRTDIPDPLSPLSPMVHRLWQVFRVTSRILT